MAVMFVASGHGLMAVSNPSKKADIMGTLVLSRILCKKSIRYVQKGYRNKEQKPTVARS